MPEEIRDRISQLRRDLWELVNAQKRAGHIEGLSPERRKEIIAQIAGQIKAKEAEIEVFEAELKKR